jgi:hypothetical protein
MRYESENSCSAHTPIQNLISISKTLKTAYFHRYQIDKIDKIRIAKLLVHKANIAFVAHNLERTKHQIVKPKLAIKSIFLVFHLSQH